ncbi:MAG: threonine--tRNA ligase, partial [Desulfofustis sp.]
MGKILINIPDGDKRSFEQGIPAGEALQKLVANKIRKQTVAVKVNGNPMDLSAPVVNDTVLEPITLDSDEGLDILRHSAAHIMALAVKQIFGDNVKVAIGPSIENGFYYDFDREEPFTPEDFDKIENKMAEIVASRQPFIRTEIPIGEAEQFFAQQGEKYKVELLQEMETDKVSFYRLGDFVDLCRGPHLPDSSWLKAFKLLRVAGSYWRGDENRPMLQRLYGTAFSDKKELKKYLHQLEEARKRDHRRLGKDLGLFTIQDQIGPGLILWQPRGALLRRLIEDYWKDEHYRKGYELLYTPHIARQDLWKTSGHLDFYGENMY